MNGIKLVELLHPAGKSAGKIRRSDYLSLCNFIIEKLKQDKAVSLMSLLDSVENDFEDRHHLAGDFRWMTLAVKLNLEAHGIITTVYPRGSIRGGPLLRLKPTKYPIHYEKLTL